MLLKKAYHNALISAIQALEYPTGHPYQNKSLFAPSSVKKLFVDYPQTFPACQVVASAPVITVDGLEFDTRMLQFTIIVAEQIENNEKDQSVLDAKIDRLSDIEDIIADWLEAIPNNAEGFDVEIKPYRIQIGTSRLDFEQSPKGLRMFIAFDIGMAVSLPVKMLG